MVPIPADVEHIIATVRTAADQNHVHHAHAHQNHAHLDLVHQDHALHVHVHQDLVHQSHVQAARIAVLLNTATA